MKILIVAHGIDKDDISESLMAYEWLKRLSEHAELWVVTAGSRTRPVCGLEDTPNVHLVMLKPKFSFRWMGMFDRAVKPAYMEFYIRARRCIRDILKIQHFDLCHHFSPRSVRMPSPFQGLDCRYIVGPLHGGLHPPAVMSELEGKEEPFFFLRRLDALRAGCDPILRNSFRHATATMISAPYVEHITPVELCKRVEVVPGIAVDLPDEYQTHEVQNTPVQFVFSGRLVASKGLELVIEAIARLKSVDLQLLVYGRGENEAYYRDLVKKKGLADKIRFEGFIERNLLLNRYRKCDVFVFPSLKEPMGVVVMEAMAAALPVLCVDTGGPAHIVSEETGIKVSLGSKERMVADLASGIERLASDVELRRKMGQKGRLRVQDEFTWDAVVRRMVALYEELSAVSDSRAAG